MSETAPLIPPKVVTRDDADEILENAVTNAYIGLLDDDEDDDDLDEEVIWIREQRDHNKLLPWNKRPSILLVGLVTLIVALATSLGEPSRASITFRLACATVSAGKGVCDPNETQVLVSNLQIVEQICIAVVIMFSSGRIGGLSDQYGRKIFIALITGLMLAGRAIGFVAYISSTTLPFLTIVFSGLVTNLTGGILTLVALVNLYISDVSEAHERIYSLGISIAALYVGLSIGPVFGSLLTSIPLRLHHLNDKPDDVSMQNSSDYLSAMSNANKQTTAGADLLPLKFEMGILVVVCLYTYFILPESRSAKAIRKSRSMSRSRLTSELGGLRAVHDYQTTMSGISSTISLFFGFLKPLRLLWVPADCVNPLRRHRLVKDRFIAITFVVVDCTVTSIGMSLGQILVMYGIYKFDWNSSDIGHFMAITCLLRAAVLIILSPIISHTLFHKFLKQKIMKKQVDMVDWSTAFLGLVLESIAFALLYFNRSTAGILLLMILASFGSIFNPAVNSAVVKIFPESKVGEYFGAMSLLKNIFSLASPLVFISVYKHSLLTRSDASLYFIVLAMVNLVCCILFLLVRLIGDLDKEDLQIRSVCRSNSEASMRSRRSSSVSDGVSSIGIASSQPESSGRMLSHSHDKNSQYHQDSYAIV